MLKVALRIRFGPKSYALRHRQDPITLTKPISTMSNPITAPSTNYGIVTQRS